MSKAIYLDYAAATPVDKRVLRAMESYFAQQFYNPSATYLPALGVKKAIETARAEVAGLLGARPAEVVFTAGATEANNLAIHGIMSQHAEGNVVVSAIEHESVLQPSKQYKCKLAPVTSEGLCDLTKLERLIDDKTVLVSIMYANNEIGTIQPIRQIGQLLERIHQDRTKQGIKQPLYFHTDAAQAANYLDLHVSRLGVDLLSLNGGKIYGPKQSGALYVSRRVKLTPLILGGGQEQGLRSGTENVAGIIGFAAALGLSQAARTKETDRLRALQQLFFELVSHDLPQASVNGSRTARLPNNVHLTIAGSDNERLLLGLEQAGILAAAGSACSASNEASSHVLLAMGMNDQQARSSLRFTMGRDTDAAAVRRTVTTLIRLTKTQN